MDKLVQTHKECVARGDFYVARRVLMFMINSKLTLGLGDIDWTVESVLNACGYQPSSVSNRGVATYRK